MYYVYMLIQLSHVPQGLPERPASSMRTEFSLLAKLDFMSVINRHVFLDLCFITLVV